MNKKQFFSHYPIRKKDSNKFDNGRVLFISGSRGMAGAAILNIIGARSTGASYIHSLLPESIYPIVATNEITAVYHVDECNDKNYLKKSNLTEKVDSIALGSGLNNHPFAKEYLKEVLKAKVPVVVDAYGLRLFAGDKNLYKKINTVIMTPHLGEFSALCNMSVAQIQKGRENIAVNFAKEHNVILVLKGPGTLVVSPAGQVYKNNSGNEALARAGSGDVLTGMIAGLCALYDDPYTATTDAVWLHGHLCDEMIRTHSKEIFDLRNYPQAADTFFSKRNVSK